MLFSRRSIQARLDAIRPCTPSEWHADLVRRLNQPNRDRLAAVYELMVVHGLNQVGSVAVEAEQVNGKNPDIEYAGLGISFVADVTTVSDAGLDKKNPYEDLSNLVESLKTKLGMPIGGVDIRIGSSRERKDRGEQTTLQMPNRSSLRQYFKTAIEPEIRQQHRSGQCPIRVDIVDEETEISVSIDPAKSPYSRGGYASYDRPSIKNRNPYYKALRSKVPQLKGVDALTGIIICDADCATMADGGFGNRIDLMDTLTRDFLRQNSSVDFVLAISVREERRGWHPAEGYDRQMFAMLRTQDALKIAGDLDTTFRSMMRNFPYPRDMPVNAARRAIEADYGWGHHGGCKMSGDNVRLSSRMIMEVLTGQISVDRMSELQRGNPFKLPFANGRLPTKIEVIPGGEDDNDDWIEFTFGGSDPAITPFK